MRTLLSIACLLVALFGAAIAGADPIPQGESKPPLQVACVGASITAGFGTQDHATESFPAQLQNLLGNQYNVHNFGASGRTMLKKGDRPYWDTKAYRDALSLSPGIVIIDLGGNDSKAMNWAYKADFDADTRAMINSFKDLPGKPRILLLLPMPCFRPPSTGINDDVITKEQIPVLTTIAHDLNVELIDMHTPFIAKGDWFKDGIHPNAQGAKLAATILQKQILSTTTQPSPSPEK